MLYFDEFKGGTISSSFEEMWCYTSDGMAIREHDSNYEESVYRWNGETFAYVSGQYCGTGKWDGINIAWFSKETDQDPFMQYLLQDGQYTHWKHETTEMDWKWSRHFLVSVGGKGTYCSILPYSGHWSIEGSIPQPVIMFLQMMRYVRAV